MMVCRECRGIGERPPLSYLDWHEDADRRLAEGEKSRRCPKCQLYEWSSEFGEE